MNDLIRRQDAINVVKGIDREFVKFIEELPSIWIPVTKATPTEDDDYLCTFGAETGWFVDWCCWHEGRWATWIDNIPNPVSNVVAWCYPIEPYQPK